MRGQQWGDMSLHCAELLNKWAAASTEYSRDLMHRAGDYAREAATVFASIQPQTLSTLDNFASALYWMVLCFATLCRPYSLSLSLSLSHTHTHTHTHWV
jgi:hypothetical protein